MQNKKYRFKFKKKLNYLIIWGFFCNFGAQETKFQAYNITSNKSQNL